MKMITNKINNRIDACFFYIDEIDKDLKEIIKKCFLEVVIGKQAVEDSMEDEFEEKLDMLKDATKFIYAKTLKNHRVGIIGELLFHVFMRNEELSSRFLSTYPTIAYADTYKGFYKGFDGIYYSENEPWVAEVKSKVQSHNLNVDNEKKIKIASKQLEKEMGDTDNNRWEKAKRTVTLQLGSTQKAKDVRKIFSKKFKDKYNQIICTLLICDKGEFNVDDIKKYAEKLYHPKIKNQKVLLMCIRSYDYNEIIKYIKEEMCDEYEF